MNKKSTFFPMLAGGILAASVVLSLSACQASGSGNKNENDSLSEKAGEASIAFDGDKVSLKAAAGVSADGSIVTISSTGIFRISGESEDAQIIVDTRKKGTVELVLEGVKLACKNSAVIYIKDAPDAVIRMEEGSENVLVDGESYEGQEDSEPDACIFSKDNLTIEGEGKLNVTGNYQGGIHGKDELTLQAQEIKVSAVADGICGKDGLSINSGKLGIESGEKGFVSSGTLRFADGEASVAAGNDCIHSNGDILIEGGSFNLSSGDDAMHANNSLTVNAGDILISESEEGLEATKIIITDGKIDLKARDDGLNAVDSTDSSADTDRDDMFAEDENCSISISGGVLTVDADGDGLDSNGKIDITGGEIVVSGPSNGGDGALDYNGSCTISNAKLIAAGNSRMAQSVSEDSSQYGIVMTFSETKQEGTVISLKDDEGKEILSYTALKDMNSVLFSAPDLKKDGSYTVCVDGEEIVSATLSKVSTWLNEDGETEAGEGFGGGHRGDGFGRGGFGGRDADEENGDDTDRPFPDGSWKDKFDKGEGPEGTPPTGEIPEGTPPAREIPEDTPPAGEIS